MKYRVFWAPRAEELLQQFLQDDEARSTLVAAAKLVDIGLARDPFGFGESRYDSVRIGFVRPLAVQYDVLEDVRTVIVDDVWRMDTKRK